MTTSVNPATTAATSAATASSAADRGMTALKSEDFFKMLVTELRQQDPLSPSKTSDMIGELSQIRGIELSKQLTDTLTQLSQQQHTAGASDLIGKYVSAKIKDSQGNTTEVSGVVTGVRFDSNGGAVLELDTGYSILASDVTRITSVEAAKNAATATTQTGTANGAASTDKAAQTTQKKSGGLFPWLTFDAGIHL